MQKYVINNLPDKFKIFNNFEFTFKDFNSKISQEIDVAVVYCCWQSPIYAAMMYYSILSQIQYTDILRTDLKIIIKRPLYNILNSEYPELLSAITNLGESVLIIQDGDLSKYGIMTQYNLNKYKRVCIVDCDAFFKSDQKINIYESFQNRNGLYMVTETTDVLSVLTHRKIISNFKESDADYLSFLAILNKCKELELINYFNQRQDWKLGCFILYNPSLLKSSDWERLVAGMSFIDSGCDETVIQLYCMKKNISIQNPESIMCNILIGDMNKIKLEVKKGQINILHPIIGVHAENIEIIDFLREIEN